MDVQTLIHVEQLAEDFAIADLFANAQHVTTTTHVPSILAMPISMEQVVFILLLTVMTEMHAQLILVIQLLDVFIQQLLVMTTVIAQVIHAHHQLDVFSLQSIVTMEIHVLNKEFVPQPQVVISLKQSHVINVNSQIKL